MMLMKTMTMREMKVGMRRQKKNLAFHQMDVMSLKLTRTQHQSVKKTWILQTTGTYYLPAMTLNQMILIPYTEMNYIQHAVN